MYQECLRSIDRERRTNNYKHVMQLLTNPMYCSGINGKQCLRYFVIYCTAVLSPVRIKTIQLDFAVM